MREKWLSVGAERAVVSQESALDLHELSDVIPNSVHLLVDRGDRGIRRLQGVTLHTTTKPLEPFEVVFREGIRVTDPVRSILDAAGAGTAPEQIEMAVRQALHRGLTTRRSLLARADRRGGRVAKLIRRFAEQDGNREIRTAEAFRTALEQRLKNESEESGTARPGSSGSRELGG